MSGMRLNNKIAIVTGGGQGIGKVLALTFAREGAKVTVASRNLENLERIRKEIEAMGGASLAVQMDLTDEATIRNMTEKTLEKFGRIDILVNNSGIAGPTKLCEDVTREEWEKCFAVNMTGMFLCCKSVIPAMKEQMSGRIINVGSVNAKEPLVYRTHYAASKMAAIGLTRTLAFELGEFGITVNTICPGAVVGERLKGSIGRGAKLKGISVEEATQALINLATLKIMVTPEDVAGLCVFLASEEGRHMTGQDVNITGGRCWY